MMTDYELDHVFIFSDKGAPEADRLTDFGLAEGSPNKHPGQGTANRRFFFYNAMIELLYVTDEEEAGFGDARRLGLLDRWRSRNAEASPFGICLRPGASKPVGPPFPTWAYHPEFFPAPLQVCHRSFCHAEPLLCYLPFGRKPHPGSQPFEHPVKFREITALRVHGPFLDKVSRELEWPAPGNAVSFFQSGVSLMEIGFDGEEKGATKDFRPEMPLRLCW